MATTKELYEQYKSKMQRIADVRNANAVLQWDQETYLPKKGASIRGQQLSTLSEIAHQMFSENELGNILKELNEKDDLSFTEKRNVALTLEDYQKNKNLFVNFRTRLIKLFIPGLNRENKTLSPFFKMIYRLLLNLKNKKLKYWVIKTILIMLY